MPDTLPGLPFEIDDPIAPMGVTGRAGVALVIELCRQLGVLAAIDARVAVKQRRRGMKPAQLVEGLLVLWTSGGARSHRLRSRRSRRAARIRRPWPMGARSALSPSRCRLPPDTERNGQVRQAEPS
jgi:hypothetical protein